MADTDPDRAAFMRGVTIGTGALPGGQAIIPNLAISRKAMKVTLRNDGPNRMIVQAVNVAAPSGEGLEKIMRQEVPGGGSIEVTLVDRVGFLITLGSNA